MVDTELQETLRTQAVALGADYFGVADLSPATDLIYEAGGEMMAQFPRAISVGVIMPFAIVDQLPRHREEAVALAYRSHSYEILNRRLDDVTSQLASALQRAGWRAFPVLASQVVDGEHLRGLFSHKLAAHLAGLGWIGKSCLLVTPEVGPRVRWATVLTDAPLAPGKPMAQRCGDCTACVEACPPGAFTGRNFRPQDARGVRFDVFKCSEYQGRDRDLRRATACGMCVYVCPHGRGG
jgi:epoxyqueuosine reductase QueG